MSRAIFTVLMLPLLSVSIACEPEPQQAAAPAQTNASTQPADVTVPKPDTTVAGSGEQPAQESSAPKSIELKVLPLSAEVPGSWNIQQDVGSRLVLNGKTPGGEVDVLLSRWPSVKQQDLDLILKKIQSSAQSGTTSIQTWEQADLRVIEELEVLGAQDAVSDQSPMRWTVKFYRSGGTLEWSVYEMNILGVTKGSLSTDEALIRQVVRSVRFDADADKSLFP